MLLSLIHHIKMLSITSLHLPLKSTIRLRNCEICVISWTMSPTLKKCQQSNNNTRLKNLPIVEVGVVANADQNKKNNVCCKNVILVRDFLSYNWSNIWQATWCLSDHLLCLNYLIGEETMLLKTRKNINGPLTPPNMQNIVTISARADGGPHSWVCARFTLCLAPHRRTMNWIKHITARFNLTNFNISQNVQNSTYANGSSYT